VHLTPRRALAAMALAGALAAPAGVANAGTHVPARPAAPAAAPGCQPRAYTVPVLVLVAHPTIIGGQTQKITVLNTLPCSVVRLRIYHAGHTVYDKKRTSDVNGKVIFSYKTPTDKSRRLFNGFFPAEATGLTQFKRSNGTYLPFDKKTLFFVI